MAPTATAAAELAAPRPAARRDLLDLLNEGFYVLQRLRQGEQPADPAVLRRALGAWLDGVQAEGLRLGFDPEDLRLASFAFVALADEVVLGTPGPLREAWARRPLQLERHDEPLAGERFFEHLERLREQGARRLAVLEVFRMCLLLGFQGRYAFEPPEALAWLTQRLADDIDRWRGGRPAFAPHAQAPDHLVHRLRRHVPAWVVAAVVAGLLLLAWGGLHLQLSGWTARQLARLPPVVPPPAEPAQLRITWP